MPHYTSSATVHSVTVWFDNTLGFGGVGAPASILVNGTPFVPPQNTEGAQGYTISRLDITGSSINIGFTQVEEPWIMIGQVTFNGAPATVPEPETWALMLTVLGGVGLLHRLRSPRRSL
jgi:hypothetical protein